MTGKTRDRLWLGYGIFLSVLTVAVGVLFIAQAADIYFGGGTYTRQIVAEHLRKIAPSSRQWIWVFSFSPSTLVIWKLSTASKVCASRSRMPSAQTHDASAKAPNCSRYASGGCVAWADWSVGAGSSLLQAQRPTTENIIRSVKMIALLFITDPFLPSSYCGQMSMLTYYIDLPPNFSMHNFPASPYIGTLTLTADIILFILPTGSVILPQILERRRDGRPGPARSSFFLASGQELVYTDRKEMEGASWN